MRAKAKVQLAPVKRSHAPRIFMWMQDHQVAANLGLRSKPSLEKTEDWIERSLSSKEVKAFAVLVGREHVGNVVLDQIDSQLRTARFSIYIGEAKARGKGIGQSATYLTLQKGFQKFGLNKIWLIVHVRNHPALKVYHKLGFAIEGVLRQEFLLEGKRVDALRMSLLRKEFARGER